MRLLNTIVCLGLIVSLSPAELSTAHAQQNSTVQFLPDADLAAWRWARENPDGIAISISLGANTPIAPNVIEETLRGDFRSHGVRKINFFWERGGSDGSSVAFDTRNHSWGPYGLATVRNEIEGAATQFVFELERGIN